MIYKIRCYGDPVLRKSAAPITVFDDKLKELANDMVDTMYHYNGVGIAAPQIGISQRIFVAAEIDPSLREGTSASADASPQGQGPHAPDQKSDRRPAEQDMPRPPETPEEKRRAWGVVAEHVMVNPEIVERNGVQYAQDGCLSVPGLYVERIRRDQSVRVVYQDLSGARREQEAQGHFAHVLQHELDHLDGILFIDRLSADEKREFMEAHRSELADMQRSAKALLRELKAEPSAQVVS